MGIKVRTLAGTWEPVTRIFVNNNGVWEPVWQVYDRKLTGEWKESFEYEVTETFSFDVGQSYYGNYPDASGYNGRKERDDDFGNNQILQGGYGSTSTNQRGFWVPNVGSVTGLPIHEALFDKEITSFQINLEIAGGAHGAYEGDGIPTYARLFAVYDYATPPGNLNIATGAYLATIAFYGDAGDVSEGYAVLDSSDFGTNPPVSGDRWPAYGQNIELVSQLNQYAQAFLSNGYLKGLLFMPYTNTDWTSPTLLDDADHKIKSVEPGKEQGGHTGAASNLSVKVTYTRAGWLT